MRICGVAESVAGAAPGSRSRFLPFVPLPQPYAASGGHKGRNADHAGPKRAVKRALVRAYGAAPGAVCAMKNLRPKVFMRHQT